MNLNHIMVPDIPPLAYCIRIQGHRVDVLHGGMVETRDRFLTDGVWAGDFASGDFDTKFMSGTGAVIGRHSVRLVSSSTPIDRIFTVRIEDCIFASNSLVFLLVLTEDELDPTKLTYRSFFVGTMAGFRRSPRCFTTQRKRRVRVLWGETADITTSGEMEFHLRDLERDFKDFKDYRQTVTSTLESIFKNAADESRKNRYDPMVSLSSGYDSSAVAVLARELGCEEAVTLLRYSDDDGHRRLIDHPGLVADQLGLKLTNVERDTWRNRDDYPDAEIAAASTNFIDIPFIAYEDHLAKRLLLVGHSGDNAWTRDNFRCYRDVVRGDTSGQGLSEFRLRVGFVILPVPYIGHTSHPSIYRITQSDEMKPWSIGGHYDRPIARRIIEESGIGRNDFATKKYAGGALVGSMRARFEQGDRDKMKRDMREFMTASGASSFLDFCDDTGTDQLRIRMLVGRFGHWFYHKLCALNYHVGKRLHRAGIKGVVPRRLMAQLASKSIVYPDYTYLFPHWGTRVSADRYSPAREILRSLADRCRE